MNNKEFIAELSRQTGYNISNTQKMVTQLVDAMGDIFQEGDVVSVANFGSFEVRKKMERIIVSPTTGQRMLVPPKLVLSFRPSTAWKEQIKNGKE